MSPEQRAEVVALANYCDEDGCFCDNDSAALVEWIDAHVQAALDEAAGRLRSMAVTRFAEAGPNDSRGAAIWDCASWLVEKYAATSPLTPTRPAHAGRRTTQEPLAAVRRQGASSDRRKHLMTNAPSKMTALDGGVEDGIEWATVRAPLWGAVNGYVRIPEGHPWRGMDYDSIDVDVHGGLTYGTDEWIGFDTLHGFDIWPETPERPQGGIRWTQEKVADEARSLASKVAAAATEVSA